MDEVSLLTNTYSPLELRQSLLNRIIDIAFSFEPIFMEELVSEKVMSVPLHLVSTESEKTSKLMPSTDFIMVDYGESVTAQYLREFRNAREAKHHMGQPMLALNFILEVGGAAYLPRQITFEHIRNKRLHLIENAPVFSRDIYANYLVKNQKSSMIEEVLNLFPNINRS
jgi:DNA-binding transcriptional LysR family regulator